MTHHCPEETNSVTSDSNDSDMWNRYHTANEGIRYNQESVRQVYFGRLLWEFSHVVFFDNILVFMLCLLRILRWMAVTNVLNLYLWPTSYNFMRTGWLIKPWILGCKMLQHFLRCTHQSFFIYMVFLQKFLQNNKKTMKQWLTHACYSYGNVGS